MNRALLELQEIDNDMTSLSRQLRGLDDGTTARATRDVLERSVADTIRLQTKTSGDLTMRELELKSAEEKIALQQKRLMNASSSHEVSALERDIAALGKARGDLDEAILTLMDGGETIAGQLKELKSQLETAQANVQNTESTFERDKTRLTREVGEKRAAREDASAKLSPAEREKFAAFAQKFGGVAVAKVLKGNCSACGAAILPFTLREAKNQEFPTCEGCGRLIYVE